jgi:predicted flap endonuclease-1-like 5' DNA nuclease
MTIMDTANTPYTFGMATGEIIILLLLTFFLGMLLCWLLRQMGLCCTHKKTTTSKLHNLNMNLPQPTPTLAKSEAYIPKVKVQYRLTDIPAAETTVSLPDIELRKPIIDPPDKDIEMESPQVEPQHSAPSSNRIELLTIDPLLTAIDPHKPIIDPPDMESHPSPGTSGNLFNDWLHKAKDSVEHLTEKATPATNDWLHKAKDSVEHLTEKATPAANEWLNKAKEIGNGIAAKGSTIGSSEALSKGSSTLAALAASAKELTEKLASNLSSKQDDLQKLVGIGPTFASVLHRAGIYTYKQLAETSPQKLQALLIVEDEQFSKHDTSSWPRQAALAAYEEWEQLKAYQDSLLNA